jgi:ABC-type lipoprotein release transport system permease subunit
MRPRSLLPRLSSFANAAFSPLQSDLRHAAREARLNKCNYCLGVSACFIAVTLVAFMYTALGFAPIFFLELSETSLSQVDLRIKASDNAHASFLNYSSIERKFLGTDREFSSMRIVQEQARLYSVCSPLVYQDVAMRYSGCGVSCKCSSAAEAALYAIDFEREDRMRLGSRWNAQPPPLGSVLVQSDLMFAAGLSVGDAIFIQLNSSSFYGAIQTVNAGCNMSLTPADCPVKVLLPPSVYAMVTVSGSFSSSGGKIPEDVTDALLMSIETYQRALTADIDPDPRYADLIRLVARTDLLQFAPEVVFNLPPSNRLKTYLQSSWPSVQSAIILFSSLVSEGVGIGALNLKLPLLQSMLAFNLVSMFFSLVISIITTVLIILLALLIYSLLLISVESRNFDVAVMRMVGTSRLGVCRLIIVQALFISVPPWLLGIAVANPLITFALSAAVEGRSESLYVNPSAFLWASVVGILVPVLSSLLPIQAALSTSLAQALDYTRPKSAAITYTIERASDRAIPRFAVAAGSLFSLMGIVLYVALPSALLSLNLFLLGSIFFSLLMAILLGLVIVGMNLQRLAETFVLYASFFWLPASIRQLVDKNLISHKLRNRKTFLMYSLSVSFIVFIDVTFSLQFTAQEYQILQQNGAPLRIQFSDHFSHSNLPLISAWANANKQNGVQGMGWISQGLQFYRDYKQVQIENIGHTYIAQQLVYTASPNLFDICPPQFLRVAASQPSQYSISEDLYSLRGGSSGIIGSLYMATIGIHMQPSPQSFLLRASFSVPNASSPDGQSPRTGLFRLQPSALLDGAPTLSFSKYPERVRQDIVVPIPTYMALLEGLNEDDYSETFRTLPIGSIDIGRVLFKLRDGISDAEMSKLKASLSDLMSTNSIYGRIFSFADSKASLEVALSATHKITNFTTVVAMIVCFFSLAASMFANISESGKEIGILRAMGMRRTRLCAVFAIEAIVLIIAASALGCAIGWIVGSAVSAQRAVFSQLPVPIVFPNTLAGYVVSSFHICDTRACTVFAAIA